MSKWYSVQDKLPINGQVVVAYITGCIPEVCIARISDEDFLFLDHNMKQVDGIQYWCSVPLWPKHD